MPLSSIRARFRALVQHTPRRLAPVAFLLALAALAALSFGLLDRAVAATRRYAPERTQQALGLLAVFAVVLVAPSLLRWHDLRREARTRGRTGEALLEKSTDVTALLDPTGHVRSITPTVTRVLGYTPDALIGLDAFTLVHPDDRARIVPRYAELAARPGASLDLEYRLRRRDGAWRRMRGTTTNLLDDPAVGGIVGTYRDITEQRQAAEELAARERRFRALVEGSFEGIATTDARGIVTYASPSTERLTGRAPEEVVGRQMLEFIHPDDRARVVESLAASLQRPGGRNTVTFRFLHADGTGRWMEATGTNLLDDPAVQAVVTNYRDITERKEAEEARRGAETRYRSLVERIPAVIYLAAPDRSAVLYTSPQREALLGYTAEEWMAEPRMWEKVVHPDDVERIRTADAAAIATGAPETVEYRYIAKGGRTIWVRDEAVLIRDDEDAPLYWQGVVVDVTARKEMEQALRESEARYRSLIELSPEPIAVHRAERYLFANAAAVRLHGADSPADFIGKPVCAFVPEEFHAEVRAMMRAGYAERYPIGPCDVVFCRADGTPIEVEIQSIPIVYDGAPATLTVLHDITARKEAEAALRESEARYRQMFAQNGAVQLLIEPRTGAIVDANAAASTFYGYPHDALVTMTVADLCVGCETEIGEAVLRTRAGHPEAVTLQHRLASGAVRDVEIYSGPVVVQGRNLLYEIIHDVTERKRAEAQLTHNALHDALTGLPNRTLLDERLTRALDRAKRDPAYRYAVLYLDFDRFKTVNDSLGHPEGDRLLIEEARRLRRAVRPQDTLARLGGDEFVLLLEELTDAEEPLVIARRLRDALGAPVTLRGQEVALTASMGIVLGAPRYRRPEELLRDADIAMYQAKAERDGEPVVFDALMHARAVAHLHLENELRQAIAAEDLTLFYQPIVALATGEVAGFEALVRWQHPLIGLIEPEAFLPLAEETGLIVPLGRWVLRAACRRLRAWDSDGLAPRRLTVSINVSAHELREADFAAAVAAALHESGLGPGRLAFEITESALLGGGESVQGTLRALKALGVAISLDDFGVGYSSLSHLHRFPIDTVKIDRSFVSAPGSEEVANPGIVAAIVAMAHTLDIAVTAEGIETAAQEEAIAALGCAHGQGYRFSRPRPAERIEELLVAR